MRRHVLINICKWRNQDVASNSDISNYRTINTHPYTIAKFWCTFKLPPALSSNQCTLMYLAVFPKHSLIINDNVEIMTKI